MQKRFVIFKCSSKLPSSKSPEGTSPCNESSQKKELGIQNYSYTSSVRRIVEYGFACWDPCRGQINELDQIQKKDAQLQIIRRMPSMKPWRCDGR